MPWRHLGGGGERRYSFYSFLTSALDGGEWSASHPGCAVAPGKGPPVPTGREAGWVPEMVWTQWLEEKSFCFLWGIRFPSDVNVFDYRQHAADVRKQIAVSSYPRDLTKSGSSVSGFSSLVSAVLL
jgi:hypothetical protein